MSDDSISAKRPWHLWAVGILGLIWNGLGNAKNYLDVKMPTPEFQAQQAQGFGTSPEVVAEYFANYPLWASIAYGFAVWAAVAGSFLLLFKSRHATTAFWIALIGFAGGIVHGVTSPVPGMQNHTFVWTFSLVIGVFYVLQLVYARWMRSKGVLS